MKPLETSAFTPFRGGPAVGREGDSYAVTVTLEGVVVRAADGTLEKIPDVTCATVDVGWLPG